MHESPQSGKRNVEGTLRLSSEARIGNWNTWTEQVKKRMSDGDLEGAAHVLACCMVGPDSDPAEVEAARLLFELPELRSHHATLWRYIVADNESVGERWEAQEDIANFLFDEFGWELD